MKTDNYTLTIDTFNSLYFVNKKLVGLYDFPMLKSIKPQKIVNVRPVNYLLSSKKFNYWVHFFIDDYQFERLWNSPNKYLPKLSLLDGIISPDFSMYRDMPKATQIYQCYRSRAIARFLQDCGLKVIPTISWSDTLSFEFCFDGIPKNSAVAISSNGIYSDKETYMFFLLGFERMINILNPSQIVFIGKIPIELRGNDKIINFNSHGQEIRNQNKYCSMDNNKIELQNNKICLFQERKE